MAAARALIGAPELVIADEPTSALDKRTRRLFSICYLIKLQRLAPRSSWSVTTIGLRPVSIERWISAILPTIRQGAEA